MIDRDILCRTEKMDRKIRVFDYVDTQVVKYVDELYCKEIWSDRKIIDTHTHTRE